MALAQSSGFGQSSLPAAAATAPEKQFDRFFLPILDGFLKNAAMTSKDFVVCDYPGGTKLKSCCTPSGKTYVSVARMLPVMAEWIASARADAKVREVMLSVYRNAFDPKHPDFWGYAPKEKATQLSVEAALVAYALWRMGNRFIAELSIEQRRNINAWLASCTQVAERKTNHAWFSALNQAVRLVLSSDFDDFRGDESWMLDDIKALDGLYGNGTDGWYSDAPDQPIYDLYNFYVFPNFPLMWGQVIGSRYPDWNNKFHARVKTFQQTAPNFFAANGSHPLMGRSLIYRWAVLSPLVLGYREKLWPHSAGVLRRIVRKQLEYHWSLGCFDETNGKLRESFSRDDTSVTREIYVDNGHPYWAMLGFAFLSVPKDDPFWTADEEPLPVEKADFVRRFEGPRAMLMGTKRSGEVRWVQARNSAKRDPYRDKYSKFVWSSHFGFCATKDADHVPPDQALVFREIATGKESTRAPNGVTDGKLLDDGVETTWWAKLGEWKFDVVSTIRLKGDVITRSHTINAPPEAVAKVVVLEGSFASPQLSAQLKPLTGYEQVEQQELSGVNLIHKQVTVQVARGTLTSTQMNFAVEERVTS